MDSSWIIAAPLDAVRGTASVGDADRAEATMPLADFTRHLEELGEMAANPMSIWLAGEAMNPVHLGVLGCAVAAAPALGSALRCFQRFFGTLQSATSTELDIDADMAHFRYRILDQDIWPRRADAELTLGLVTGIVRRFAPDAERALGVQMEVASQRSQRAISEHLGRPLRQGDDNVISIPARLLDRRLQPVARADDTTEFRNAVQSLDRQHRALWLRQPTSHRVVQMLLGRMGHLPTDQDAIAREMGMSHRTLRRQLDSEGTSFQDLTELCRRNIGHALLVRTDMPMIEIALRLGYSDHTAFSRAFARWFGASPRELRKAGSGSRTTA